MALVASMLSVVVLPSAPAGAAPVGTYTDTDGWWVTVNSLTTCHWSGFTPLSDCEFAQGGGGDPWSYGNAVMYMINSSGARCSTIMNPGNGGGCPYGTTSSVQVWRRHSSYEQLALAATYAVSPQTWGVSLSVDVTAVSVGHGAILTATADKPIGGGISPGIQIYDQTAHQWVGQCGTAQVCRVEVYVPSGPPHLFWAQIYDSPSSTRLAVSGTVRVVRAPWAVSLGYDQANSRLVAVANQAPASSGLYVLQIFNADTGAAVASCTMNPCTLPVGAPAAHYVAQVGPSAGSLSTASNVQARSGVVYAPSAGPTGEDGRCQCSAADPVTVPTGRLHESVTDLAAPGRGGGLTATRSYSSEGSRAVGQAGWGWTTGYGDVSLRFNAANGYGGRLSMGNGAAPAPCSGCGSPPGVSPNPFSSGETVAGPAAVQLSSNPASVPADAMVTAIGSVLPQSSVRTVEVSTGDGGALSFVPSAAGSDTFVPEGGHVVAGLTHNADGTWTLTEGRRVLFAFNQLGRLTRQSDLDGDGVTLSYDGQSRLQQVTDDAGRSLSYAYTDDGLLDTLTDPAGRAVHYGYDSAGNLTSVTDPAGGVTGYGYDAAHRLTTVTDPRGHTTTTTYDPLGHVTRQVDRAGRTTTFGYAFGNPETVTIGEPNGSTTVQRYTNGELTSLTRAQGNPEQATWTYTYDPVSFRRTSVTDPLNHTWTTSYDADGNQLTATDPLGHTTTATYNALDEPLTVTGPDNVTTSYAYDTVGHLLSVSTPLTGSTPAVSRVTAYHHDDPNHPADVTSVTDPDGKVWLFGYDTYGQLVSRSDPLGHRTTLSYTCLTGQSPCYPNLGLVYWSVPPRGNLTGADPTRFRSRYRYDADGRLTSTDGPAGSTSSSYDGNGNRSSSVDAASRTTSYAYDNDDEPTTVTRPDATTVTAGYDGSGNVTARTDGAGHTWSYGYDPLDRLVSATTPPTATSTAGIGTTYSYDAAGRLATSVNAGGATTGYGYDHAGRLTSIGHSDGTTPDVTFGYDNADRRTSMTDGSGTSGYTYDSLGRLTDTTDGAGHTTHRAYDLAGHLTALTYPNGQTVTRTHDDAHRLTGVTDWNARTTTFSYDADDQLTATGYPDGSDETRTYDDADRLTGISIAVPGTTGFGWSYDRAPDGRLAGTNPLGATTPPQPVELYDYTPLGQLGTYTASQAPGTYTYDTADNLTGLADGTTRTFDSAGELLTSTPPGGTPAPFGYDPRGNRTSGPSGGATASYGYDQADRLTSYTQGTTTAVYRYDGDGLRTTKTVDGATTTFAWDTGAALPLLLADSTASYVYGPGGLGIEQIATDGTTTYLHHDQLGSTRVLTDASGTLAATYRYDPRGRQVARTGTADTPLRFAGEYLDTETDLYYLRARYYDPTTAQFLTRDPLEARTGAPYGYAGDDPLDARDPSGLDWCAGPVCLGFHPSDAIDPIVNMGRGMSLGLSDRIADRISAGASCTVGQDTGYQALGAVASNVAAGGLAARLATWLRGAAGAAKAEVGGGTTQLFRTVGQSEARDVAQSGVYRNPSGLEGKYFFPTRAQAESLAAKYAKLGLGDQTLTSGQVSNDLLQLFDAIEPAGEGPAFYVPNELLHYITDVGVLP